MEGSFFSLLPKDVFLHLFRTNLLQNEALHLRLVCKEWAFLFAQLRYNQPYRSLLTPELARTFPNLQCPWPLELVENLNFVNFLHIRSSAVDDAIWPELINVDAVKVGSKVTLLPKCIAELPLTRIDIFCSDFQSFSLLPRTLRELVISWEIFCHNVDQISHLHNLVELYLFKDRECLSCDIISNSLQKFAKSCNKIEDIVNKTNWHQVIEDLEDEEKDYDDFMSSTQQKVFLLFPNLKSCQGFFIWDDKCQFSSGIKGLKTYGVAERFTNNKEFFKTHGWRIGRFKVLEKGFDCSSLQYLSNIEKISFDEIPKTLAYAMPSIKHLKIADSGAQFPFHLFPNVEIIEVYELETDHLIEFLTNPGNLPKLKKFTCGSHDKWGAMEKLSSLRPSVMFKSDGCRQRRILL